MVVQVFVAGGESEQPLGEEGGLGVFDAFGCAWVVDGGVERGHQPDLAVGFA